MKTRKYSRLVVEHADWSCTWCTVCPMGFTTGNLRDRLEKHGKTSGVESGAVRIDRFAGAEYDR